MLENRGIMKDSMRDVCELFDFVTEKKRTLKEIEAELNSLAHAKYCLDAWGLGDGCGKGTAKGHLLRKEYKRYLQRNLNRMLSLYARLKKDRPICFK